MKISILDTTLRDGAQCENVSFSVNDKLKTIALLDSFGISYIEAGNPASNPTDREVFARLKDIPIKNAKICAFASTVRKGCEPECDENIAMVMQSGADVVAVCGKAMESQANAIIGISGEENLALIKSTIEYFKEHGREVIFDAEHFFDAFKQDKEYACKVIEYASEANADIICLCDTNGGCLPYDVAFAVKYVCEKYKGVSFGVHCHDDSGCAVANSLAAIENGAVHIQGTLNGIGERCGNANLSTLIPNIALKTEHDTDGELDKLYSVSSTVAEISNKPIHSNKPYVGRSAFAHKGGQHTDGMMKADFSYEHIDPALVGNKRRFLMSELSGRSTILAKSDVISKDDTITKNSPQVSAILEKIKQMEHYGYSFEAADASFELIVLKTLSKFNPHFDLILYKVIDEFPSIDDKMQSSATIKIAVNNEAEITASLGNGPVNALDLALRKALAVFYPQIKEMYLTDYKVRVLDENGATASLTRVIIESSDGRRHWSTVGVSPDIIEASLIALIDSVEYFLHHYNENQI